MRGSQLHRTGGRWIAALLTAILITLRPAAATAHAILLDQEPAVDKPLSGDPFEIRLRFNNRVDGGRSLLEIIDEAGSHQAVTIIPGKTNDILIGQIGRLLPGKYRLRWQVLALDGHITRGDVPLVVDEPRR